jgi:hypothetical protein
MVWELDVALDAVTAADFPEYYRRLNLPLTILPTEQVAADTWAAAHALMPARLSALAATTAEARRTSRRLGSPSAIMR